MPRSLVTDRLLDMLAQQESNNNPQAIGDNGLAVGAYQMQPIAYQDVQQHFPQEFGAVPYEQLRTDPALQRKAARAYLQVGEQKYGITDLKRLISFYNAGPRARKGALINQPYVDRVLQRLGGQSMAPKVDKDFERIAFIDGQLRNLQDMGLAPLGPSDIERLLSRTEVVAGPKRPAQLKQGAPGAIIDPRQVMPTEPSRAAEAATNPSDRSTAQREQLRRILQEQFQGNATGGV